MRARARDRLARQERRLGIAIFKVLVDHRRVVDDESVMSPVRCALRGSISSSKCAASAFTAAAYVAEQPRDVG
jgi:hypothetical protein